MVVYALDAFQSPRLFHYLVDEVTAGGQHPIQLHDAVANRDGDPVEPTDKVLTSSA